jgi:Asp-tRNA(Asn)/Glu-tRNA(Gln) amidotransferase A subunit family amidase
MWAILNEPIIITLLTLSVGGLLFNGLTAHRARKEKIREKAIELLEEVGRDLNSAISLIFGRIRNNSFVIENDSPFEEKRRELFTKRFTVRIRSKTYLKSDEFWQKYERLMFELDRIIRLIKSLSKDYDLVKLVSEIQEKKKRLEQDWPIGESAFNSNYDPPSNELEEWTHMVFNRAVWLLTVNLKIVLE